MPDDPTTTSSAAPHEGDGTPTSIDVADHPLRRLVVLGVIALLVGGVVLFGRPSSEDPRVALAPYLGETAMVLFRTDPGAAPDDRTWLRDVILTGFAERDGTPVLEVEFAGQVTIGGNDAEGAGRIPVPVDRLLEVFIGAKRIYKRVE